MPAATFDGASAVVDGKIYFISGLAHPFPTWSNAVQMYDPTTDGWSFRAPMPTARAGVRAAEVGGIIYAIGGYTSAGVSSNAVEAYDPLTNMWAAVAPMPTARHELVVVAVSGIIYAIGGQTTATGLNLATVEAYDPATNMWTSRASLPFARSHIGGAAANGLIYVFGGTDSSYVLHVYNPVSNTWSAGAPMHVTRTKPATGVIGGLIYVAGGTIGPPNAETDVVEVYDPVGDVWSFETSMPTGREGCGVGVVNNVMYVGGGHNASSGGGSIPIATMEAFSPAANLPPVADAGVDRTVGCTSASGASVQLNGTGSMDPDGDTLSFHWDAPGVTLDNPDIANPTGTFPIGVTMATLTVTDGHGGLDVDDVLIAVVDADPPQVVVTTSLAALWPPNHNMMPVALYVLATDNCTAPQNLILLSATISSNEPDDANGLGDGETTGDVNGQNGFSSPVEVSSLLTFNPNSQRFEGSVALRAERDGNGGGRAYTIKAWVLDTNNNIGYASCVVVVPKNQRK